MQKFTTSEAQNNPVLGERAAGDEFALSKAKAEHPYVQSLIRRGILTPVPPET